MKVAIRGFGAVAVLLLGLVYLYVSPEIYHAAGGGSGGRSLLPLSPLAFTRRIRPDEYQRALYGERRMVGLEP